MTHLYRHFIITAFIFLLFSITLFSCTDKTNKTDKNKSGNSAVTESTEKTNITATFYPLYTMLLNITDGAQDISLNLLAPANTGCLHDYQITTKDMNNIQKADILVAQGAGMEDFLEKAIALKKDKTIIASDGFFQTKNFGIPDNAHIWVSVEGAIYEVEKITEGLVKADEKNASLYKANCDKYVEKLTALKDKMHSKLDAYKGYSIITFHEAFPYFAKEFDLNLEDVIEREAGTNPSAKELQSLIELVNEKNKDGKKCTLFAEPQYSSSAAQVIAKETGCSVYELDPCVTGELNKDSYINAMERNLDVLLKAFTNK